MNDWIEKRLEQMRKEERIWCPYCNAEQQNDDGQYPVTYWGEDSMAEFECDECNKTIFAREIVRRTYESAKTMEGLNS